MISTLAVSGYRSLRDVVVGLGRLTVVTGPNGSGRSSVMVLNEPETSLHPDLVPSLARLVAGAARRTQVVVVTHSSPWSMRSRRRARLRCGTSPEPSRSPRTSARPASKDKDC